MSNRTGMILAYAVMAVLIAGTGVLQSWNSALNILNFCLIYAIMSLGVNLQWGYAGLFNVGVMGFTALGGLAAVLVAMPPVPEAWNAGGPRILAGLDLGAGVIIAAMLAWRRLPGRVAGWATAAILVAGFFAYRAVFDPGVAAVESVNASLQGYMGGLGLPVLVAWPVGGLLAAGAAWAIGKVALGLRSDYLAIATLGIAEIVIAIMKAEEWLARGVKNVAGIPRPVPDAVDLQSSPAFVERAAALGADPVTASTIAVKLGYSLYFTVVLIVVLILAQLALNSPWGRMMRAIRDNEVAAEAMGKDVTARHLQIFVMGCFLVGLAGAMMTTLDGQLTPGSYQPLRFTFLIWVMVIVGGSGNNYGAVLGAFLIWFLWVQVEPLGGALIDQVTSVMQDGWLKTRLIEFSGQMRLLVMGVILLAMMRFAPRGLIPER